MGISASQSNLSHGQRRRPSIHSGKLYTARQPPERSLSHDEVFTPSKIAIHLFQPRRSVALPRSPVPTPVHGRFNSNDFDKSNLELKENLPDDLKAYCNSIEIVYRFWCSEIETLSEDGYQQMSVLFYMNVVHLVPEIGAVFGTNIEKQAQQFFGMFRWIINNFKDPHPERLIKRIKRFGKSHQKMGIKEEWYDAMLQALHDTLYETVKEKYTARIRFCWEQLYTVVMNIMMGKDLESLSSEKIARLVDSLKRLEDTLNDEEANVYLELYMKQQFCVELLLFYQDVRRFKACSSGLQRQDIGEEIMKKYFGSSAECEINLSYGQMEAVYGMLKANHRIFTEDIFDECSDECKEMIRNNIWFGFKRSIMRMTVEADIHYHEIRASKSNFQFSIQPSLEPATSLESISKSSPLSVISALEETPKSSPSDNVQSPQFSAHLAVLSKSTLSKSTSNLLARLQSVSSSRTHPDSDVDEMLRRNAD